MGVSSWLARKGNIGGTARAVANGWKRIKERNPGMSPRDIAEAYVNLRYTATREPNLAEEVLNGLPFDVNPLDLSWVILSVENKDEPETLSDHRSEWIQIMREEIRKYGLEPGESFFD